LINNLENGKTPKDGLIEAFISSHAAVKESNLNGGSTALVAYFVGEKIFVANAGDSRAVLCKENSKEVSRLTTDHKPHLPEEEKRIKDSGGFVTKQTNKSGQIISRVNGMLAVSRAIGDNMLDKFISQIPDVKEVDLSSRKERQILILACDGLWDVLTDEDAAEIVSKNYDDPETAAITLRDTALNKGSTDNISVIVVVIPTEFPNSNNSSSSKKPHSENGESTQDKKSSNNILYFVITVILIGTCFVFLNRQ